MPNAIEELQPDVEVSSFPDVATAKDWLKAYIGSPCVVTWRFAWADEPAGVSAYLSKMSERTCNSFDATVLIAGREAKIGVDFEN